MSTYLLLKLLGYFAAVAVPTATVLGTKYLHRRWNLDISKKEQEQIFNLAREAVMIASQKYRKAVKTETTNQEKLKLATRRLLKNASKLSIKMTEEEAEHQVEAAINNFKREREMASLKTLEQ